MSGVGDWAAFEAVDEEVTSAVVSDIYAEFISIVFSDDAELIENTLASSFSACLSGQILHRITENDSSVSGLGDRIAASEIRWISGSDAVADNYECTVLSDPYILVTVGSGWL